MFSRCLPHAATALLLAARHVAAIDMDIDSEDSIKDAASVLALDTMSYYSGNESGDVPGILPQTSAGYYWWQAGALWGLMIDYWAYTGDDTYNDVVAEGMFFQTGADENLMPANQTATMGNDDQGFWVLAILTALENDFQRPPNRNISWLSQCQRVFDQQTASYNLEVGDACDGGLRWQKFAMNAGFTYKNSISNGVYFDMGARLARFTGNDSFAEMAGEVWDWMESVGFIDDEYNVYGGAHVEDDCSDIDRITFSTDAGVFMHGAANMYNYTDGNQVWRERLDGLIERTLDTFFTDDIAIEVACEPKGKCNIEQKSFKGLLLQWMGATIKVAPYTREILMPVIAASAEAAVAQCTGGGGTARSCGFTWSEGEYDGDTGLSQEMAALAAVSVNLVDSAKSLRTARTARAEDDLDDNEESDNDDDDNSDDDAESTDSDSGADRLSLGLATTLALLTIVSIGAMHV